MKIRLPLVVILLVFGALLAAHRTFSQETTLTSANPIKVDTKERSVAILAEVNRRHPEPTHHGVVFKGGKFSQKAIFIGVVDPKAFYESLVAVGFKAGGNMTMDNMERTYVDGESLEVSLTWKGAKKTYRLDEIIKDSNGRPLVIRFGGNLDAALKKRTGCLLCLDSCPVGITSNATYTYGAIDKRKEAVLTGNKDLLPPHGTPVVIIFKAKK